MDVVARLSRESEQRDALNVLATDRRELALELRTPSPLGYTERTATRRA